MTVTLRRRRTTAGSGGADTADAATASPLLHRMTRGGAPRPRATTGGGRGEWRGTRRGRKKKVSTQPANPIARVRAGFCDFLTNRSSLGCLACLGFGFLLVGQGILMTLHNVFMVCNGLLTAALGFLFACQGPLVRLGMIATNVQEIRHMNCTGPGLTPSSAELTPSSADRGENALRF